MAEVYATRLKLCIADVSLFFAGEIAFSGVRGVSVPPVMTRSQASHALRKLRTTYTNLVRIAGDDDDFGWNEARLIVDEEWDARGWFDGMGPGDRSLWKMAASGLRKWTPERWCEGRISGAIRDLETLTAIPGSVGGRARNQLLHEVLTERGGYFGCYRRWMGFAHDLDADSDRSRATKGGPVFDD